MDILLPFVLALAVGFTHAFEADHLVAVSSIVTQRNNIWLSLKDGAFWGLGHTSTILLVGIVFIAGRVASHADTFRYLEAGVGLMLVVLGMVRLYRLRLLPDGQAVSHTHIHNGQPQPHTHRLAYGVGLVHGLAGSGALMLSVLTQIREAGAGLVYLLLFGLGSMAGMMVAASAFSIPFSVRLTTRPGVRTGLIVISAGLCIVLGIQVLYENLAG